MGESSNKHNESQVSNGHAAAAAAATKAKGSSANTEAAIKGNRQIVAQRQIKKTQDELQWIAAQRLLRKEANTYEDKSRKHRMNFSGS